MGVIQKIYSTCHSTRKTPLPAICTCVGFLLDRWTTRVQGLLATVNPRVADLTPDPNATGRTVTGVALGSGMFSLAGAAHIQDDNKAAVSSVLERHHTRTEKHRNGYGTLVCAESTDLASSVSSRRTSRSMPARRTNFRACARTFAKALRSAV